jgi:hypothetical protein
MTERAYLVEVASRQSFRRSVFTRPRPLTDIDVFVNYGRRRVRSKSLPGLILPFHTKSIIVGGKRRTGAGPP